MTGLSRLGAASAVLLAASASLFANHYRGGSIQCAVTDSGLLTVELFTTWRSNSIDSPVIKVFGPGVPAPVGPQISINPYEIVRDLDGETYVTRKDTRVFNLAGLAPGTYRALFSDCCWIQGLNNHGSFGFLLEAVFPFDGTGPNTRRATPTLYPTTLDRIVRNQPFLQNLDARDADGDSVTVNVLGVPDDLLPIPHLLLDPASGTLAMASSNTATLGAGRWTTKLVAEDSSGARAMRDVVLTVQPDFPLATNGVPITNAAPTLAPIGPRSIRVGNTLTFQVTATDTDPSQTLTLRARALPLGAVFQTITNLAGAGPLTSTFAWTPTVGQEGRHTVMFEVFDSALSPFSRAELIQIDVAGLNNRPTLDPIGTLLIPNGGSLRVPIRATDPDVTDSLSFQVENLPDGAVFDADSRTLSWTPAPVQFNQAFPHVHFTVTDDGAPPFADSESVTLVVGTGNRPPTLLAPPLVEGLTGHPLAILLEATDPDLTQTIQLFASTNLAHLGLNPAPVAGPGRVTNSLSWIPPAPGQWLIEAVARDSGVPPLKTRAPILFRISGTNQPPVFVQPPPALELIPGDVAPLSAVVLGTPPLTFQWFEGVAGDTSRPRGTNGPAFTSAPLSAPTAFWLRATNAFGAADSETAAIRLIDNLERVVLPYNRGAQIVPGSYLRGPSAAFRIEDVRLVFAASLAPLTNIQSRRIIGTYAPAFANDSFAQLDGWKLTPGSALSFRAIPDTIGSRTANLFYWNGAGPVAFGPPPNGESLLLWNQKTGTARREVRLVGDDLTVEGFHLLDAADNGHAIGGSVRIEHRLEDFDGLANPTPGLYLARFQLISTQSASPSPPFWIVYAHAAAPQALTLAHAWVADQRAAAPVTVDDGFDTPEDVPLVVAPPGLLANDIDWQPPADPLSVVPGQTLTPIGGTCLLYADGSFSYQPPPHYFGPDSFPYIAQTASGLTNGARVFLAVRPVNDPPDFRIGPSLRLSAFSGPATVPAWLSDISPGPGEGTQIVTFELAHDRPDLFLVPPTLDRDGTLRFEPQTNASGTAQLTVRAVDNGGIASGGVDRSEPQSASLELAQIPFIKRHPASRRLIRGSRAWLDVLAVGPEPLHHQWFAGLSGDASAPILDATAPAYMPPPLFTNAAYWVRVTNLVGAADSVTAWLTLAPAIDVNADGQMDIIAQRGRSLEAWILDPVSLARSGTRSVPSAEPLPRIGATADLTEDALDDLITSRRRTVRAHPLERGQAGPSFVVLTSPTRAKAVAHGWFNNDPFPDLTLQSRRRVILELLQNRGAGAFSNRVFEVSRRFGHIAGSGDFNADGRDDLVVNQRRAPVIYPVTSDLLISSRPLSLAGSSPGRVVAVADFNADERPDLLVQRRRDIFLRLLNGTNLLQEIFVGTKPPAWRIVGPR